jgi:ankyrin repeat protein
MSLWELAFRGDTACLRALLDTGVDVNVPDKPDITALMLAAHKGHDACLTMLLERGARVNAHTYIHTYIHYSLSSPHRRHGGHKGESTYDTYMAGGIYKNEQKM